ncbi:MAG: DUF3667 domain-containing protein [Bacteroidota bacterium]|nr:DUF3667 domain-containing protein [Ignavibacteria bacterium]MCU7498546.1 DUF3667 domain-containing protein [Ignavibacteria bacterium]MCU7511653.1 DUF3667 domain-containing protein [Ignavibacteria bacterium]MCU7519133.1 DUF3667 domain-containing protein [Ignavibacteria bacterium]MCU7523763.1 DUF3667 domain-containing protein [Ignavibacteria bacterium]
MSHNHSKSDVCLNCGYEFKDENNYCPSCGQQNHSLQVPFKHLVLEFLEGTIHLDTKIFQTFKFLLFKPGYLTREFNTGKRAGYVPPVRIYVFVSFIFFLLVGLMSGHKSEGKEHTSKDKEGTTIIQIGPSDSDVVPVDSQDSLKALRAKQKLDSLMASKEVKNSALGSFINSQVNKRKEVGEKEFSHSVLKNISYLMFILMPLFASFVMLFNVRKGHYYYEFLIYSIHFHSFLFLLFSCFLGAMAIYDSGWFILAACVISIVYFIISMKNAFPQKTSSVLWKAFSLIGIYGFTLFVCLLVTLIVSVMLM